VRRFCVGKPDTRRVGTECRWICAFHTLENSRNESASGGLIQRPSLGGRRQPRYIHGTPSCRLDAAHRRAGNHSAFCTSSRSSLEALRSRRASSAATWFTFTIFEVALRLGRPGLVDRTIVVVVPSRKARESQPLAWQTPVVGLQRRVCRTARKPKPARVYEALRTVTLSERAVRAMVVERQDTRDCLDRRASAACARAR
jgi:hypothetical protein